MSVDNQRNFRLYIDKGKGYCDAIVKKRASKFYPILDKFYFEEDHPGGKWMVIETVNNADNPYWVGYWSDEDDYLNFKEQTTAREKEELREAGQLPKTLSKKLH